MSIRTSNPPCEHGYSSAAYRAGVESGAHLVSRRSPGQELDRVLLIVKGQVLDTQLDDSAAGISFWSQHRRLLC